MVAVLCAPFASRLCVYVEGGGGGGERGRENGQEKKGERGREGRESGQEKKGERGRKVDKRRREREGANVELSVLLSKLHDSAEFLHKSNNNSLLLALAFLLPKQWHIILLERQCMAAWLSPMRPQPVIIAVLWAT